MKTIWKYQLHTVPDAQVFRIPGWQGVAHIADQDHFANMVTIWCHVDTDKPNYVARFLVTATGEKSPSNDYVFAGSAICGGNGWHVWRNAVTEKADEGPF